MMKEAPLARRHADLVRFKSRMLRLYFMIDHERPRMFIPSSAKIDFAEPYNPPPKSGFTDGWKMWVADREAIYDRLTEDERFLVDEVHRTEDAAEVYYTGS